MCLATPARVKKIENNMAIVDFGGVQKRVSLGVLTGVKKNDYVLVHAGFAIGKVKKIEVGDTIKALEELREVT